MSLRKPGNFEVGKSNKARRPISAAFIGRTSRADLSGVRRVREYAPGENRRAGDRAVTWRVWPRIRGRAATSPWFWIGFLGVLGAILWLALHRVDKGFFPRPY